MLRVISFNTNGIRARPHQLERLRERYAPDLIGIQETKVRDEEFPLEMTEGLGYRSHFFGQKGHYGVALLSTLEAEHITHGFPDDPEDAQRRLIGARYHTASDTPFTMLNGYFPQGESREHPQKFPTARVHSPAESELWQTTGVRKLERNCRI